MVEPRRIFLGWDEPVLPAAARRLLDEAARLGEFDLSGSVVVVPTSRAARLFRGVLVEEALARGGGAICPPAIVSPGELRSVLARSATPPAGVVTKRLAWIEAIRAAGADVLGALLTDVPLGDDAIDVSRVARLFEAWHRDVCAAGRRFGDVASVGEGVPGFADADRWRAADVVQREYERILASLNMHDEGLTLIDAIARAVPDERHGRHAPLGSGRRIALLGVVDLAPVLRAGLALAPGVTALVAAPESERDWFDAFGLITGSARERWATRHVPLEDASIRFAEGPDEQARAALHLLARACANLADPPPPSDIVVAVAETDSTPSLAPALAIAARCVQPRGIETRDGRGRPIERTPVATLVRLAGEYARTGSMDDLAALVRHPDCERWLLRAMGPPQFGDAAPSVESWLASLDRYRNDTVPESARGTLAGGHPAHRAVVERLRDAVDGLLGPLLDRTARPAASWAREWLAMLSRAYEHRRLRDIDPVQTQRLAASDAIRDAALDMASGPPTPITSWEAGRLLLESLDARAIAPEPGHDAIEMVGWLEVALDPAPIAIVVGLNEGQVPAASPTTPMLPDSLRRALGLDTSESRLARDAYLLTLLAQSKRSLGVVVGRRDGQGNPLRPSRLLFADEDAVAARRLERFVRGDAPRTDGEAGTGEGDAPTTPEALRTTDPGQTAMPIDRWSVPESLSVTAFGAFLRSPYEFFLRRARGLEDVEEAGAELDGRGMGTLLHEAVGVLAGSDAGASDDPSRVRQALSDALSDAARARFGPGPRAVVRAQIEIARERLAVAAGEQADWARTGWRVVFAERDFKAGAAGLVVDKQAIGIHGRIDRIDRHDDGRWAIFDYKTGESPDEPDKAHRRGRGPNREWTDLQLPLYRHLAAPWLRAVESERDAAAGAACERPDLLGRIVVGYFRIGASPEHIGVARAEWDAGALADADAAAANVVRAIRGGEFRVAGRGNGRHEGRVVGALSSGGWGVVAKAAARATREAEGVP
ncbi:MAG: PD-(D/E)XK nuclease family protein [Phycisphaerales bacterium]|nr:PD-(D/E)XK nuclease family protein [Phycisphaerales bacterium]MCB9841005.1 PD-(D/E)XK nuclease family protein [Phycisphaeraceae bacterium]